ncbi:hypothetical protein [Undibacterium sp. Tian12W]|uniref:hypothetical protein n=1 Tax=Undibacterium sp. Tian12W TaxID=3413054 RepID=UPI003BF0C325
MKLHQKLLLKLSSALAFGCCLAITSVSVISLSVQTANAATSPARIGFSSKTVGFEASNARNAGSMEYALIEFITEAGTTDASVAITVSSSNPALISVSKVAVANALGNYLLAVPASAPSGTATITASATVAGVTYTRSRVFVITAASTSIPPVSGSSTITRATTPTMNADQSGCAVINYYDVGVGKAYTALGQLPWSLLKGCDTVRIYAKPNNLPYHEMILISAGTNLTPTAPNKFMRVIGVPDPVTGARPIIDGAPDAQGKLATQLETLPGQAARTLQYHDNASTTRALYKLGLVMVGPQAGYNYNNGPVGYIGIENLDIRNSVYGNSFSDAQGKKTDSYASFGTCLFVEAAAHLVVKNNVMHNCGNGLFINSKNGTLVELSQDVLIEANTFYNNGNAPIANVTNGYSEHNSYTEARDIIFQYNYFGDVRPGAFGDCLKDRSSGLIVRYNTFASSCGLQLHLMDSTGGNALIYGEPNYASTYVYGNLFEVTPGSNNTNLVNYGGDSGLTANYRQGTLFFYNNTMVVRGDATHGIYPETLMFNLGMPNAVADVRNNLFYALPVTPGAPGKVQAMALGKGTVNMTNNWVSPNAAQYWEGHLTGAVVNGWSSNLGGNNNPVLANVAQHDYRPALGSPLINAGNGLGNLTSNLLPVAQPGAVILRKQDGMIDIGAFEF